MKLTLEEHDYPNPAYKFVVIKLGGIEIGSCDKTPAGLVPRGKRKPVPLDKLAEAMVRSALKDARARKQTATADEERAQMMLRSLMAAKRKSSNVL